MAAYGPEGGCRALGHSVGTQYAGVSAMLGIGLLTLWFLLWGHGIKRQSIKDLLARAILSLTGNRRPAPDPWLEATVRVAFAEFDRELALILRDRPCPVPPWAGGRRHPDFPRG